MSLKTIRAELAADLGIPVSNAAQSALLDKKINDAAQEIWNSRDLPRSLVEQLFIVDTSTQCASLPLDLLHLRGARHHESRARLDIHDMRPRYKCDGWKEPWLGWRVKRESPISRDILNSGPLTLTLQKAEAAAVTVVVTGSTHISGRTQEVIVFGAGETEKTTTNSFLSIDSINQPELHDYNVVIEDVDGNEIATLLNNEYSTVYTIIQQADHGLLSPAIDPYYVECLYKPKLYPLKNDHDEFPLRGYDKAIYWKTMELKAKTVDEGVSFAAKCEQVIAQMVKDATQGIQKTIDFAPEPLAGIFGDCNPYRLPIFNG
jgi:hypothetical protein